MLTTRQKVLRRFWYATEKLDALKDGPKPFKLLGENIVLFLDDKGEPAALMDRCCHRTSKLSKGWSDNGLIVCGYHGWTYDRSGMLRRVPQLGPEQPLPRVAVRAYHCAARYGYAWVCLDEPLAGIPDIPEEGAAGYRRIHQFHEAWNTAPLRLMENSFDTAHFSFVHKATFGQFDQPRPEKYEIVETDYGFEAETIVTINNPPFCRRLDIEYPSGIRHIIFNSATPIDDGRINVAQLLYRNDTEADCSAQELIAWDAAIILEDKDILESTDPDTPIDLARKVEAHMPSDRPGVIMRRRLLELIKQHGETEVTHAPALIAAPGESMTV